jgi:hypothetical protein
MPFSLRLERHGPSRGVLGGEPGDPSGPRRADYAKTASGR